MKQMLFIDNKAFFVRSEKPRRCSQQVRYRCVNHTFALLSPCCSVRWTRCKRLSLITLSGCHWSRPSGLSSPATFAKSGSTQRYRTHPQSLLDLSTFALVQFISSMGFFFFWNVEDYVLDTKEVVVVAVFWITTSLEFSSEFKEAEHSIFTICFFFFQGFVEFLFICSARKTVELSNVPFRPLATPPATLSVLLDKYQRCLWHIRQSYSSVEWFCQHYIQQI